MELEADIVLTARDFEAMRRHPLEKDRDLAAYLRFLDEIGAFTSKRIGVKIYSEEFKLEGCID